MSFPEGLTPAQLAELEHVEQPLIEAWLDALAHIGPGVHSPIGWFLAGVRSGNLPGSVAEPRVRLAELRLRNIGALLVDEADVLGELFESRGALLEHHDTPELRARMLERWHRQTLGTERTSQASDAQPLHPSQVRAALTAVSADSDPDADIPW